MGERNQLTFTDASNLHQSIRLRREAFPRFFPADHLVMDIASTILMAIACSHKVVIFLFHALVLLANDLHNPGFQFSLAGQGHGFFPID